MARENRSATGKANARERLAAAGTPVVELLEGRTMLTAALASAIPTQIDPTTVGEQLFADGTSTFGFQTQQGSQKISTQFFLFAQNNAQEGQATTFAVSAPVQPFAIDTALAVYDASGNLLQKADSDNPQPSTEQLSVVVPSGQPFIVGLFDENIAPISEPAMAVNLTVTTPPQSVNAPIKIDPATGQAQLIANTERTTFTSPSDVHYYPLDFTNAGASGTVTVSAPAPETKIFAALFRQDSPGAPWQQITSGSGAPINLNVTPPANLDLTDAKYVLAVSPLNFSSPAQPYQIDLNASVLAPTSVAGQTVGTTLPLAPTSAGIAEATNTQALGTNLYSLRAVTDGPITLSAQGTTAAPVLSLYDSTGASLLGVAATQQNGGSISLTVQATKGQQFLARIAPAGTAGGTVTLDVTQAYTPTELTATTSVQQQAKLPLAPATGGQLFRITPAAGTNFLVLRLAPDAGSTIAPQIVAVASGPGVVQQTAAAGKPVTLTLDLSKVVGPVDVYINGTSGTGTATFSFGALAVPQQIAIGQLANKPLDVTNGGLSATVPAPAFGQLAGVQFYELSPGQVETFNATASNGATPLLVRYVQSGGTLRLDASGTSALTAGLQGTLLYAVGMISLDLAPSGTVQLQVSSTTVPQGVGVELVPNKIPLPNQPPPTAPFLSQLQLQSQVITRPEQRDLFATILPFNLTGSPTLSFTPGTIGGPLAVKISVLDANNAVIKTFTTQPGQALAPQTLSTLTPANSAGATVRLLVEPLAGQPLGDGIYNIEVDVPTSDPNPFLVTESKFPNAAFPTLPAPVGLPFGGTFVGGSFTSSSPQIQIFKLTLPDTKTPFKIFTVDVGGKGNTDIKIYRGVGNPVTELDEFDSEPPPSFDEFPADRSKVDAEVVVNNPHILDNQFTGKFAANPNTIFVVVKNEQGAQGNFLIAAAPVIEPTAGPGTKPFLQTTVGLTIDPENGQAQAGPILRGEDISLAAPHGLIGQPSITVTSDASNDVIAVDLLDLAGNAIFTDSGPVNANKQFTTHLPLAPSSETYLRVFLITGRSFNVQIAATVSTAGATNQPNEFDQLTDIGTPLHPNSNEPPYVRAQPTPDGKFTDTSTSLPSLISSTLRKIAFYVPAPGVAHISGALSGIDLASLSLYAEGFFSGEFPQISGSLADFTTQPGADGNFSFDVGVNPGLYVLKLVGRPKFNNGGTATITASIPAYNAQHITLDPTTAQNDQANLQTLDTPTPGDVFRTQFYEVQAPGGVQGPLSLNLHNLLNSQGGLVDVTVYKKTASGFTSVASSVLNLDTNPPAQSLSLQTNDTPVPGDQYFIAINRDRTDAQIAVGPSFNIPQPGQPDLVVQPIELTPDNGQTRVKVTIRNIGFSAAGASKGLLTFSNFSTPINLDFSGVGPFGTVSYITDWTPTSTSDTVSFVADVNNAVAETNENNNSATVALSSVDAHAPSLSFALKDPTLNAEGSVLGRFVSNVPGVKNDLLLTGNDVDGDVFLETISGPVVGQFTASGGSPVFSHVFDLPVDFGTFLPTSSSFPNVIHYDVIDAYGLRAPEKTQSVDVVAKPSFLTSVTFDPQAKQYKLDFVHDVINEDATISQILGFDVPVVGDKDNQFLVHVEAHGTASLDPTKAVSLPLTGRILLKAVDETLYDESFNGTDKLTDHLTFTTTLSVESKTLQVTAASASLQLQNLNLLHFQSPLIPIFSVGLPDVASIDAGVKFGLDANLSAGVKLGVDPNVLTDPLSVPDSFGVQSPTFIEPSITGTATAEGSVNVLGFDVADLQGTVKLTLDATIGLDNNDPAKVFSFDDFFHHLAVKVTATLGIHLEADVFLIGDIWDFDYNHTFDVIDTTTQGIITKDPGSTAGKLRKIVANPLSLFNDNPQPLTDVPPPVIKKGTDLVGPYKIDPHPQIVIDPNTGRALAVQVVNTSQTPGVSVGNLAISTRNNTGTWSPLTTLSSGDVANPKLALTHDNQSTSFASAVVYEAMNGSGTSAGKTFNQKLTGTDIRFRYFNGTSFGAEQSITNDGLLDTDPSVSFNSSGKGLVAFVHNTSTTPIDANGNYSRNTQDIEAAIYNPATHSFGAPLAITTPDGVADFNPATYVDDNGKLYVFWLSGTPDHNVLMFSTSTGGAWSAPQALPITGLTPGGSFKSLAVGRDNMGRIDVIFSYRDPIQDAGDQVHSFLFSRSANPDDPGNPNDPLAFSKPQGVEVIDKDANYSDLQTTNAPDGSLIAYWLKSDGVDNGIFASTLSRSPTNPSAPWTTPSRLTTTADLTIAPSLAVDTNGHDEVLFDQSTPKGSKAAPSITDPQVGVPLAPGVGSSDVAQLPELAFSEPLNFPVNDTAAAGSTVTGFATIVNHGGAAAQVTIDSFVGTPDTGTKINTRQITLAPGKSYDYSQDFVVAAGQQTYSVRVSSATGEAFNTSDDVSMTTLTGLSDLVAVSLTPSTTPLPGKPLTLTATIVNQSTAPIGAFDVILRSGDPHFPQFGGTVLATQHVAGLAASQQLQLQFPITAPSAAGTYVFSAVADSGNAIAESVETNNQATTQFSFSAEPSVSSVTAANNNGTVTVTVNLGNSGVVPVSNVPVHLQVSRNGGAFTDVATRNVSIAAGGTAQLTFQTPGLAGDNVYRASFDPSVNAFDSDITDNSGEAELVIQGAAELSVGNLSLSNPSPRQGAPLSVNATISNTGIADATSVLVEVFAKPNAGGQTLTVLSERLPLVGAKSQLDVSLPIDTTNLSGAYTLTVQVNRLGEVLEGSTADDSASILATFGSSVTVSNVITAQPGVANTITFRRDASGLFDDVFVNVPETGNPTQLLDLTKATTIGGSGKNDTLVFDNSAGDATLSKQLVLDGFFTTDALSVAANQLVQFVNTPSLGPSTLSVKALNVDPAGTLDIGKGSVQVHYSGASPINTIATLVRTGFNGGVFNGHGITTSQGTSSFGVGYTDTGASTLLLKYVRFGDANLDGQVNFSDLLKLAQNFNKTAATFDQGDFDYNGTVAFPDLLKLAQNFGQGQTAASLLAALSAAKR